MVLCLSVHSNNFHTITSFSFSYNDLQFDEAVLMRNAIGCFNDRTTEGLIKNNFLRTLVSRRSVYIKTTE